MYDYDGINELSEDTSLETEKSSIDSELNEEEIVGELDDPTLIYVDIPEENNDIDSLLLEDAEEQGIDLQTVEENSLKEIDDLLNSSIDKDDSDNIITKDEFDWYVENLSKDQLENLKVAVEAGNINIDINDVENDVDEGPVRVRK